MSDFELVAALKTENIKLKNENKCQWSKSTNKENSPF